jgi:hypothetical protein
VSRFFNNSRKHSNRFFGLQSAKLSNIHGSFHERNHLPFFFLTFGTDMILVTGGTGLVGAHLLWHLLQKGEKVRAIHRPGSNPEQVREVFGCYEGTDELFGRIEWLPADMLDLYSLSEAMNGISRVYHCAAMVSFNPAERKSLIRRQYRRHRQHS